MSALEMQEIQVALDNATVAGLEGASVSPVCEAGRRGGVLVLYGSLLGFSSGLVEEWRRLVKKDGKYR